MGDFRLEFTYPALPVQEFSTDRITIGRSDECDLQLDLSGVSKKHAAIMFDGNDYLISDLKSTTGTKVEGKEIRTEKLVSGSSITIGEAVFCFQVGRAQPGAKKGIEEILSRLVESSPEEILLAQLKDLSGKLEIDSLIVFARSRFSPELFPFYSNQGKIREHSWASLQVSKSLIYRCHNENKPVIVSTAGQAGGIDPTKSMVAFNIGFVLALPLSFGGEGLGVLYAGCTGKGLRKSSQEILKSNVGILSLLAYCLYLEGGKDQEELDLEQVEEIDVSELFKDMEYVDPETINWIIPLHRETAVEENQALAQLNSYKGSVARKYQHPKVYFDDQEKKLRVKEKGVIRIDDKGISFKKLFHKRGNVDKIVGDINFNGKVVITGEVKDGFEIRGLYDIEIGGKVGKSDVISSLGSITIGSYVVGEKENCIQAFKDVIVDSPYTSVIKAFRKVSVKKKILNSVITAGKEIEVTIDDKFKDVILSAGQRIIINKLPKLSDTGYIELKINTLETLAELMRAKNSTALCYARMNEVIRKTRPAVEMLLSRKDVYDALPDVKKRVIRDHAEQYRFCREEEFYINEKVSFLNELISEFKRFDPVIKVKGYLPEGTTVFINGACLETDRQMSNVMFTKEGDSIRIDDI